MIDLGAGRSYCNAAEIQLKQDSKHEAATMYNEGSNCYRKSDPNEALNCLLKTVDIYIDMVFLDRFTHFYPRFHI